MSGIALGFIIFTQSSSIPDFRRATLRLLNDNERTHTLQRQNRRAGSRSRRGRRAEELGAQSRERLIVGGVRCTIADARYDYLLSGRRLIDIMPAFYTDPQEIDALIRLGCADSALQKFRARA